MSCLSFPVVVNVIDIVIIISDASVAVIRRIQFGSDVMLVVNIAVITWKKI